MECRLQNDGYIATPPMCWSSAFVFEKYLTRLK